MNSTSIFSKEEEVFTESHLVVDVASTEVKNVCHLMNAIIFEVVACKFGTLCKERCLRCEVNHPSQRRDECLMLSEEEGWELHSFQAIERVVEQGTVWKECIEAVRVTKLGYYEHVAEHRTNSDIVGTIPIITYKNFKPSFLFELMITNILLWQTILMWKRLRLLQL